MDGKTECPDPLPGGRVMGREVRAVPPVLELGAQGIPPKRKLRYPYLAEFLPSLGSKKMP